jgi:hypothetical protein
MNIDNKKIVSMVDTSIPPMISGIKVTFVNGYSISIITGPGANAQPGLFEIAIFRGSVFATREVAQSRFPGEDYDDVIGFLTKEEVESWSVYVSNIGQLLESGNEVYQ